MSITHCFQKLSPWLCSPMNQIGRAYLEAHVELLSEHSMYALDLLIAEYNDAPDEQRRLRKQQGILRDAIIRGGTPHAVREAYINAFSGFVLDLPPWLLEFEQFFLLQPPDGWTERGIALCKLRLYDVLGDMEKMALLAPEVIAELQYHLASFFANYSLEHSVYVAQQAINYYQAACQIYTAARYPQQYARVQAGMECVYTRMPDLQLYKSLN